MQKLNKSDFMHKVINDKYNKKYTEKEKSYEAINHLKENFVKIQRRIK